MGDVNRVYGVLAGVKVLVEFEGVRDTVCLRENKISCMKFYHITYINTNSNAKRETIELETQANASEGNLGMKAMKFLIGIPRPGIYNDSVLGLCLALIVFVQRSTSRFQFASANLVCAMKMGGICEAACRFGWASREELAVEIAKG